MELLDTYRTLSRDSEGLYKEKGSKFLAFASCVDNEEDVKDKIAQLKKHYYDARHHCFAYVLGEAGSIFRANDDGEPGHSAGDPILGQIRSHQLTNTLIVVVRYFGGTKLGVSGLINAYKTAAAQAIENNVIVEKIIYTRLTIQFAYPLMSQVMKMVRDYGIEVLAQDLGLDCRLTLGIRRSLLETIEKIISETRGVEMLK